MGPTWEVEPIWPAFSPPKPILRYHSASQRCSFTPGVISTSTTAQTAASLYFGRTHFHLLVRVKSEAIDEAQSAVGILLSSYTKAINHRHARHGSLFQRHTKAKWVDDDRYLLTLLTYIHQNPIRARLVDRLEAWPFSS